EHLELRSMWVALQVFFDRERGDPEHAARVARQFLAGRETWLLTHRPGRDETALCFAACAAVADDAGRRKIAAERRTWLEESTDGRSALGWALAYGLSLEDA